MEKYREMVGQVKDKRVWNIWSVIALGLLAGYASPAYAHGGADFFLLLFLIWVVMPLFLFFLIVFPVVLLLGKIYNLEKKRVVAISAGAAILIYIVALPNMQSIIKWLLSF
jgi:hypothetical protein